MDPSATEATGERQVLVTGGTSGIGRAIALAFAAEGCRVIATGLSEAEVEGLREDDASLLPQSPDGGGRRGEIVPRRLDVTDDEAVRRLVEGLDRLDVLVNAAGAILRRREHDPADFARVVDVNLNGVMRVSTSCWPFLARSRGVVLNIGSMLGFFGSGQAPGYSASKGGVAQLTRSLAIAWAPDGIRVNAIAPGWIRTALTAELTADAERSRAIIERTPLGRWGEPEDVTGAALFLCSPAAAFITGAILPVDGGYSAA